MFDYPIRPKEGGEYEILGLGPEATSEEVNEAKTELRGRLERELARVENRLDAVFAQLPELREVYAVVEGAHADEDAVRRARSRLPKLERQAVELEPEFLQLRTRAAELKRRHNEVNCLLLPNPEQRRQYDERNPPLALLKLADCRRDRFADNTLAMALIRRELADFFTQHGEQVVHPSDITRDDFTNDFAPNPILDGNRFDDHTTGQ